MRVVCFYLAILVCVSCFAQLDRIQPVQIILDTDMGSDCDDVGALALLNEFQRQGIAEIAAVIYSSEKVKYGVGVIDAINRYYGHDDIPIGASYDTLVGDPIDKMLAEKLSKDTVEYGNRFIKNTDVTEQVTLLRQLLSDAEDESLVYVTIGHTKGLHDLLVSKPDNHSELSGMQLIHQKVNKWVALGALKANDATEDYHQDWNFFRNNTAQYTDYLVDHFPKPIFFIDAGTNVMTGKSLINTPSGNIVRTAYRDWLWNVFEQTLVDQRPSWDLMAVLFSVGAREDFFVIEDNGYLDFDPQKGCRWIKTNNLENHRYVMQKKGLVKVMEDYLNEMITK